MPSAIVAGMPPQIHKRLESSLRGIEPFSGSSWSVTWLPSKSKNPGIVESQVPELLKRAAGLGGAHVLLFRARDRAVESAVVAKVTPFFRFRYLDCSLLRFFPHSATQFFAVLNEILAEELEWCTLVQPKDEACCLLLPECAFQAEPAVANTWFAASQAGLERIRSAARALDQFRSVHWLPAPGGERSWTDRGKRVFGHRGARHGSAPFPRAWKYSMKIPDGFHFDVTSREGRPFHVRAANAQDHPVNGSEHLNIDPHGHVRGAP